jgi:uncharacterized membrane protein YqjE
LLVTFLAFIYLPVSLAGTILGMNVKEITPDNPRSIKLYIVVSLLLLITTLGLLGLSATVTWYRQSRRGGGALYHRESLAYLLCDQVLFVKRRSYNDQVPRTLGEWFKEACRGRVRKNIAKV